MERECYTGSTSQDLKVLVDDLTGEVNSNSIPGSNLSDMDSLEYFFDKYKFSVKRGKPNQKMANNLKLYIDLIQVKNAPVKLKWYQKLIGAFKNRKL